MQPFLALHCSARFVQRLRFSAPSVLAQPLPTPPSNPAEAGILVEHCMVQYINKTKVPAESQGKLTKLNVEEGMAIKKGDVIAIIDDKQALIALKAQASRGARSKLERT